MNHYSHYLCGILSIMAIGSAYADPTFNGTLVNNTGDTIEYNSGQSSSQHGTFTAASSIKSGQSVPFNQNDGNFGDINSTIIYCKQGDSNTCCGFWMQYRKWVPSKANSSNQPTPLKNDYTSGVAYNTGDYTCSVQEVNGCTSCLQITWNKNSAKK